MQTSSFSRRVIPLLRWHHVKASHLIHSNVARRVMCGPPGCVTAGARVATCVLIGSVSRVSREPSATILMTASASRKPAILVWREVPPPPSMARRTLLVNE